jgi:hypothetical protein
VKSWKYILCALVVMACIVVAFVLCVMWFYFFIKHIDAPRSYLFYSNLKYAIGCIVCYAIGKIALHLSDRWE